MAMAWTNQIMGFYYKVTIEKYRYIALLAGYNPMAYFCNRIILPSSDKVISRYHCHTKLLYNSGMGTISWFHNALDQ